MMGRGESRETERIRPNDSHLMFRAIGTRVDAVVAVVIQAVNTSFCGLSRRPREGGLAFDTHSATGRMCAHLEPMRESEITVNLVHAPR